MKKNYSGTVFFVAILVCLSTHATETNLDLQGFSNIHLEDEFKVHVQLGDQFNVVATAADKDLEKTNIYVKGNTLYAEGKPRSWWRFRHNTAKVHLNITLPAVSKIAVAGAVTLSVSNILETHTIDRQFELYVSGSSEVKMGSISTDQLKAEISGAGSLLFGDVETHYSVLNISGSSTTRFKEVETNHFKSHISGAGTLSFESVVAKHMELKLSGSTHLDIDSAHIIEFHSNVSGASDMKVSGVISETTVKIYGVGSFDGSDLITDVLNANLSGAASITVKKVNQKNVTLEGIASVDVLE